MCSRPTCVYEPSWCAFAELFGLVRQSDLNDPGDVSGRRLHPDGMRRDQLEKEGKGGTRVSTQIHAPDRDQKHFWRQDNANVINRHLES